VRRDAGEMGEKGEGLGVKRKVRGEIQCVRGMEAGWNGYGIRVTG